MKRVCKSKSPTINQLKRMSFNLREKFNESASIDIEVFVYSISDRKILPDVKYRIYIADTKKHGCINMHFFQWLDCQQKYFELMKEEV